MFTLFSIFPKKGGGSKMSQTICSPDEQNKNDSTSQSKMSLNNSLILKADNQFC